MNRSHIDLTDISETIRIMKQRDAIEREYVERIHELSKSFLTASLPWVENLRHVVMERRGRVCISDILHELEREAAFQKSTILEILQDVDASWNDYNSINRANIKYQDAICSKRSEKEHRKCFGELMARHGTQKQMAECAFRRFCELDQRRLEAIRLGLILMAQSELELVDRRKRDILGAISAWETVNINEIAMKREGLWKQIVEVPPSVSYVDPRHGKLKDVIFGLDLCDYLSGTGQNVCLFLITAIKEIEARGLDVRYLYLRSAEDEDHYCYKLEENMDTFDWNTVNIFVVASMIKRYFKDLPQPIFPFVMHEKIEYISSQPREDIRLALLTVVIRNIPAQHKETLRFLLGHLSRVAQNSTRNGMTAGHLANEFYPCLVSQKAGNPIIIEDLLKNYTIMFAQDQSI